MSRAEHLRPDQTGLARAASLLRSGGLVAFATETVYGLGADATNAEAIARLFAAKARPHFNPLICHYPSAAYAFNDVDATPTARALAAAFWPGPLTMVLRRRTNSAIAMLTGAGLDTLAVRVPAHADAQALLAAVGRPIAAPSANRSGRLSPTEAQHVLVGLADSIDAVMDSGACPIGVESTVLDLSSDTPTLLRPGGLTVEAIEHCIGPFNRVIAGENRLRSPGMLASHYAPNLPVRLDAHAVDSSEALLAFGPPLPGAALVYNLSETGDLVAATARLYAGLHELDAASQKAGLQCIAVMPIPESGLGLAIRDRLNRAAAPRD